MGSLNICQEDFSPMQIRSLTPWTQRQTIASDTSLASRLVDGLLDAMLSRGWSSTAIFHVQLAYEEAIVNAIVHGNGGQADKTVEIAFHCDAHQVQIVIADQGPGFDPCQIPDPRQSDRLDQPGGRGLLLMQEVMCEAIYNVRGNQLTLIKRRSAKPGSSSGPE
jgi:serine/threonine-protein kinase RsbW